MLYLLLCVIFVHSSFAIISMGSRELVDLLCSSSGCLVIVVWLFRTMPWVCLQFVMVVFPVHTHYFNLFLCTAVLGMNSVMCFTCKCQQPSFVY